MGKRNSQRSKQGSKPKLKLEEAFSIARIVPLDVNQQPWPCLLISQGTKKNPILTFYNASDEQHQFRLAPELVNKIVHQSHGEWLLIQDAKNLSDYCILNIVTMEKLQLPPQDEDVKFRNLCGFFSPSSSSNPTIDADCQLLITKGERYFIMFRAIGAKEFITQELEEWKTTENHRPLTATKFQGKFFYISLSDLSLYCSELEPASSDKVQVKEMINGEKMGTFLFDMRPCFLIECCGQLWYVDQIEFNYGERMFQILRADLEAKAWEKLHHIGDDYAIFVDDYGAFGASVAGCGLRGNCVYYTEYDDTLNVYGLEDGGSFTLSSPLPFRTPPSELRWILISNTTSN